MNKELLKNGYLYIPNFISKDKASALAFDFKTLATLENLESDYQAPIAQCKHNFLPFIRLQVEKIPQINDIVGELVLPTYTYARIYHNGSVLKKHIDRPACEISLTINLEKDSDWPIWFENSSGEKNYLELEPGDAALYFGCSTQHGRDEYKGYQHIQVFVHYVLAYGEKSWAFYDLKRTAKLVDPDSINYQPT